ncbi:DUF6504 family protein [Arsenicicoccus sp. oral taxon 190]|uniref:DUF6504 family protein n=1 Tax=Arsenicicoccus sp. oral taxon 190 TaxID=1658671 RepID=UPI00067A1FB6|nr:DUF6504 family protein [Arsenicicoccus sp. oral taxon 190]AKT52035.1 hypothetical protein ADJ73_13470 [Arsenicicoccus sp. oral taxon 190]
MRRCEDAIEVRHDGRPLQFIWRGRLYDVRSVVDHWRERRPWWREVPDTRAVTAADLEGEVWRVEAAAGRSGVLGVYDLAVRGTRWQLVALSD